jgi:hypothetical protein
MFYNLWLVAAARAVFNPHSPPPSAAPISGKSKRIFMSIPSIFVARHCVIVVALLKRKIVSNMEAKPSRVVCVVVAIFAAVTAKTLTPVFVPALFALLCVAHDLPPSAAAVISATISSMLPILPG